MTVSAAVLMPKTTVDKDQFSVPLEHQIWLTRE
jgi:hypothetical protein